MRYFIFFILASAFLSGACTKVNQDKVGRILVKGTWKVEEWVDKEEEQTDALSGYHFNFTKDQLVNVSFDTLSFSGKWSLDEEGREVQLNLDFDTLQPLNQLSEPWNIVYEQKTAIELKRTQDRLFLEKN